MNDRFVIKVVRKTDIQLFTQMATSYFDYLHRTTIDCKPTLFAKIIGAYSVSWKDNANNTSMKKYVLVMENVFYGRKIKQVNLNLIFYHLHSNHSNLFISFEIEIRLERQ